MVRFGFTKFSKDALWRTDKGVQEEKVANPQLGGTGVEGELMDWAMMLAVATVRSGQS